MKVKQRLKINNVVTIIAALLISLVLFQVLHEIKNAVRASGVAGELITGALERSAFRSDYIRSGNERAKKQWFAKHEQIGRLLKSASDIYHDPEDIKTIQNLIKDHETTGEIFSGIVESREMPKHDASSAALAQVREDRLNAQLEVRLYTKILLARMLRESADNRLSYVLALAGLGIICILIILITAAIINSWTMGRTIIDRIRRLSDGALMIGEGDLDYRIDVKGDDELAELSGAFNAMSAKLQRSYQDLNKEIDTRIHAEEGLRKSEERLRLHAENSPTAIIEWDSDFIVMRWAGEAEHIFGWSAAETVGKPIMDLGMIYEEDIPIVEKTIGNLTDGVSRKVVSTNRNYTKDGRVIHCEWYNSVLIDANGEMASVMSQVLDITERKQAEEERVRLLAEVESRAAVLDATISSMATGLIVYDMAGKAIRLNETAKELLPQEIFFNMTVEERARVIRWETEEGQPFPPEEIPVARALHGETTHNVVLAASFPDRKLWISASAAPIRTSDGRMMGVVASFIDISDRKKAEAELRESEERFKAIVSNTLDHILVQDRDLRYSLVVNPQLGLSVEDMIGKTDFDFLSKEDAETLTKIKKQILETGNPVHLEMPLNSPHGGRQFFDGSYLPKFNSQGRVDGLIGYFRNITERKRAEEALMASKAKLETALASMTDAVVISDSEGRFIEFNQAFATFHKFRNKEEGARTLAEYPAFLDVFMANGEPAPLEKWAVPRALKGETAQNAEYILRRKDTGESWVGSYSFAPIRDPNGVIVGAVVAGRDITERRRIEESNKMLAAIVESSDDAIIGKTLDGTITSWNRGAEHMYGYSNSEILGKPISVLAPAELKDEMVIILEKIRDGAPIESIETLRVRKDGSVIHVSLSVSPIHDTEGKVAGASTIARDITERKKMEEDIFNLLAELERSNKELEQFAYVASHDLQEPLRMVSSFTQLLAKRYRDKLDQDAMDYIDFAVKGSNRMQRMIQDLLNYSRVVTRGKAPVPTDMDRVLDETLVNLHLAISDSGVSITHDALPIVMADHSQLVQVFQNLIGNAIKFRRDDPLHIHVSAGKVGAEWVFSVKDNGMGIEPQYFERIFVLFERLHAGETYRGTGIGLALCKRIIDRLGGRIWVESEPNKGSTFYFTLQGVEQ